MPDETGLCETCIHRRNSLEAASRWNGKGMVIDTAPKAECKAHEGYGHANETRTFCRDYKEIESNEA